MSDETVFCDICGVAQKSVRGLAIHKGRMHPESPISEPTPVTTIAQVIPTVTQVVSTVEEDMEEMEDNFDEGMYPTCAQDFPKVDPSILGIKEILLGSLVNLTSEGKAWRIEDGQAILATVAEPIDCTVKHRYLSNDVWTLYLEANRANNLFLLCLEQEVLNGLHKLGRLGAPVEAPPVCLPSPVTNEVEEAFLEAAEAVVTNAVEVTVEEVVESFEKVGVFETVETPETVPERCAEIVAQEIDKDVLEDLERSFDSVDSSEVIEEVVEQPELTLEQVVAEGKARDHARDQEILEKFESNEKSLDDFDKVRAIYSKKQEELMSLNLVHNVAISYVEYMLRNSRSRGLITPLENFRTFCFGAFCLVDQMTKEEFGHVESFIDCVSATIRGRLQISSTH